MMRVFVHEFVTGGGLVGRDRPASLAAEARFMRRAFAADFAAAGCSVVMTLEAGAPDEPGPWYVVRVAERGEEAAILEHTGAADHTLIIAPETDGILERRLHLVQDAGGSSLSSTPEAVAIAGDKIKAARLFVKRDVRTPVTRVWSRLEGLPRSFLYPAILKPIDGVGCLDTIVIESAPDEPSEQRFPHPSGALQRYVPGRHMSASFLVSESGRKRLLAVAEQMITIADGRLSYRGGRLVDRADCCDSHVRRSIDAVPGLKGFVGVDFVWSEEERQATVIEINPRPTTTGCALIKRLGPGILARTWLETLRPGGRDPEGLPMMVRPTAPVGFRVDDDSLEVEK